MFVVSVGFLLINIGFIRAKCINQYHNKLRTIQGEETKQYKCRRQNSEKSAFDANDVCTYCGCLKDFHNNDNNQVSDQDKQ